MELLQLRYLCTAARFENFSRAAKYHNIPQSAISKTIAQLERELGTELFERRGNRVMLNERGRAFCRDVQHALDLLQSATVCVQETGAPLTGEVVIQAGEHASAVWEAMADFRRLHEGVTFRLLAPGDAADAPCALRLAAGEGGAGDIPLRPAEVCLLLGMNDRLCGAHRVALSALDGRALLSLPPKTPAARVADRALSDAGLSLPRALLCPDTETLLACVGAGMGIGFAAGISRAAALTAGVALCHLEERPTYPTHMTLRAAPSPAEEAFAAFLRKRLTEDA